MNLEPIQLKRRGKLGHWFRLRLSGMFRFDIGLWRFAVAGIWLLSCAAAAVTALGMPTGFGLAFDIVTGIALNTIALPLSSAVAAVLISLAGWRIPRFTMGSMLYLLVFAGFLFYFSEFRLAASILLSVFITVIAVGFGVIPGLLVNRRMSKGVSVLAGLAIAVSAAVVMYAASEARTSLSTITNANINDAGTLAGNSPSPLGALSDDPSRPGKYVYRYFTYGSGQDLHRPEFGNDADLLSQPADASAYIQDWSWLRSKFWGFDETKLPLNGRVWMPEGAGPFPLVIMVHGNHLMEQFSDEGYGYLGELLASRGMAAVSVDENFFNYSAWSGIPEEEMEARAWLLLKHIQQIQQFSKQASSPFYNRIDFHQVALLGHSRGGQAAAMAAGRQQWFKEDARLPADDSYSVQAVIALAPIDSMVDGKYAELENINFFTLQGAKDADVVNFDGDRLYGRASFPNRTDGFKASLYIADANHSQFNTEWDSDLAYPAGLFIQPEARMDGDKQRQIAEVYVSAFLETVFHGSDEYKILFRDYRAGGRYLPATRYYSQFQSGKFQRITDFSGTDRSALSSGATAHAENMSEWEHVEALNRERKGKGNTGVILGWKQSGSYSITVNPGYFRTTQSSIAAFSMADFGPDAADTEYVSLSTISVEVEVEDHSGVKVRLPLERFMDIQPLPVTDYTWLPGKGSSLLQSKYEEASEPVFQTYELPLGKFQEADTRFDPTKWTKLTLHFDGGPGKVMLDEIGIMP